MVGYLVLFGVDLVGVVVKFIDVVVEFVVIKYLVVVKFVVVIVIIIVVFWCEFSS